MSYPFKYHAVLQRELWCTRTNLRAKSDTYLLHQEEWLLVWVGGKGEERLCANDTLPHAAHSSPASRRWRTCTHILRKSQFFFSPVWPLQDLVFSLVYSPRIIKSWQLCFSLMPCQHWMWVAHHHVTKLNSSYYNQQICLHLKCSWCRIVVGPFLFLHPNLKVFFL